MGGAIARGLAAGSDFELAVSNRSQGKLDALKAEYPAVAVSTSNREVAKDADVVVFAVKPWLIDAVAADLLPVLGNSRIMVSIVAGVDFAHLEEIFPKGAAIFRVIPNTAIAIGESMTVIASHNANPQDSELVMGMFSKLGKAMMIEERAMGAATALGSCGTAFALRYIRAAMESGIEMGLYPDQAKEIVAQTVKGAADLLMAGNSHPEAEIDKVTTPGGITIKGLNRMEECGFTAAVIAAHKASLK